MNDNVNNLSLIFQALSLCVLFNDFNNKDLMQELVNQDTKYFDKIIEQNKEILRLLKELKNGN